MVDWNKDTLPVGTRVVLRKSCSSIVHNYKPGDAGVVAAWVTQMCIQVNWDRTGLDRYGFYARRFDRDGGDPW